ncbi:MAG: hypothetical protein HQK79_01770 [Desulfobacterales bacterium]|nr:hypothetical protein [Desulfobacterales bacterium]MBF0397186.1 hypothetical protein [Desulfobacterales bacterium]
MDKIKLAGLHVCFLRFIDIVLILSVYFFYKNSSILLMVTFLVIFPFYLKIQVVYRKRLNIFTKIKQFLETESNINFDRLSILLNSKPFQHDNTKWIFSKLVEQLNSICLKNNELFFNENYKDLDKDSLSKSLMELTDLLKKVHEIGFTSQYEESISWFPEYKAAKEAELLFKNRIESKIEFIRKLFPG